ncbi:nucleic acid-binding protein [Sistotremastrum suecicum HHB10207 ss-3]|uniref:Nucleic acid-binding protein n=1 Tax=Sistotremastrum suecicum HHB10207 ss-3 TaxID=1314776 RepID=A0A166ASQ2_9AGAM|nr:nucleic acid-binding protein [Sistotremastrum suecicum HHB10207 ss-3]
MVPEEFDFPRGGGSSLTALEERQVRKEGILEAEAEIGLEVRLLGTSRSKATNDTEKTGHRIEHLNYKRMVPGMKMFCQVVAIHQVSLIVSLPNQLFGHIPITQISSQLTQRLEKMDQSEAESEVADDDDDDAGDVDLASMFEPGQFLSAVVSAVRPAGTREDVTGSGRPRNERERASRRVELSLIPSEVNAGISTLDLKPGFVLTGAVKSVEDHGYILDLGLPEVPGFISLKDVEKSNPSRKSKFAVGHLLTVCVKKLTENGRTCTVTLDANTIKKSCLSDVSNVGSLVAGTFVQGLVTSVSADGLNLQLLGSFEGTVDVFHLSTPLDSSAVKSGSKVKARILYDVQGSNPPRFALSMNPHIVSLDPIQSLEETYPVGLVLDDVKVVHVDSEWGLIAEISDTVRGFVHISHTSDDHVPSLNAGSGPFKLGTRHRARVLGYHTFDGLLQLSFRTSVIDQKFIRVGDVKVGETVKGTIKKLTESGLFVSLSNNIDGVIWPNHYADIALKHPQKRFKEGSSITCRILGVDAEREKIMLTAKKTLVQSELPIISNMDDVQVGMTTHGVISKILDTGVLVEFYDRIRAFVPLRELSDTPVASNSVSELFPLGKPVKVAILSMDKLAARLMGSIRQALSQKSLPNTDSVSIGDIVSGSLAEIHKDNLLLTLQPIGVRALMSLRNLANHRNTTVPQLRTALKPAEEFTDLVVLSRNAEKGFVIVANQPTGGSTIGRNNALSFDNLTVGQILPGQVVKQGAKGVTVKFTNSLYGSLHPADVADDFESNLFPAVGTTVQACILELQREKKQIILSTRPSRVVSGFSGIIADKEVTALEDLEVGRRLRGFIKSITDHGIFVTVGRNIDARVQIKELFDGFVKDWKDSFRVNQVVEGRILSLNKDTKKLEMTLRSGDLKRQRKSLSEFQEGQKVEGKIKRIEDYGVFIAIPDTSVSGLCHKSEISDVDGVDVQQVLQGFQEGDNVKAIILSIDKEKKRISFGLKPSYFNDEDFQIPAIEDTPEMDVDDEPSRDSDVEMNAEPQSEDEDSGDNDANEVEAEESDEPTLSSHPRAPVIHSSTGSDPSSSARAPALKLSRSFQWNPSTSTQLDDDPSEVSSEEEVAPDSTQKKKRKKKKHVIEEDKTADAHTKLPESTADFERMLLGSPNSSYIWIQYMSFQLQLSEIDKAREIGRRGLQTISFREEGEKLNVWIALLNLENEYGSEESMKKLFLEAAKANDSKTVHLRMASIFEQSQKHEKAEEQLRKTVKKFSKSSKAWTLFAEYYLRNGQAESARALLPRSLQSLEARKHLKTISKFAQLEYKLGDSERGKTIFEGIVDSHPKRWDLWSVYIDMEAVTQNIQGIRNIFDRVLALKMSSHKAKAFFKKWLELERRLGNEEGAEAVKAKAIEWTKRASQTNESTS